MIIAHGNLLEPVEKVETLEIFGIRDFLLQTDSPIETLSLRWDDIDWEMNRMSILESKVEHHEGRGIRSCPIFPELRPILDESVRDLRGQERIRGRRSAVSSGSQYSDGLEERQPTN